MQWTSSNGLKQLNSKSTHNGPLRCAYVDFKWVPVWLSPLADWTTSCMRNTVSPSMRCASGANLPRRRANWLNVIKQLTGSLCPRPVRFGAPGYEAHELRVHVYNSLLNVPIVCHHCTTVSKRARAEGGILICTPDTYSNIRMSDPRSGW